MDASNSDILTTFYELVRHEMPTTLSALIGSDALPYALVLLVRCGQALRIFDAVAVISNQPNWEMTMIAIQRAMSRTIGVLVLDPVIAWCMQAIASKTLKLRCWVVIATVSSLGAWLLRFIAIVPFVLGPETRDTIALSAIAALTFAVAWYLYRCRGHTASTSSSNAVSIDVASYAVEGDDPAWLDEVPE